MTDAGEKGDLIGLEPHPGTATEAQAATRQIGLDLLRADGETRREALDDDDEGLTMRLTGGQEAQHGTQTTRPRRPALESGTTHFS